MATLTEQKLEIVQDENLRLHTKIARLEAELVERDQVARRMRLSLENIEDRIHDTLAVVH